MPKYLLLKMAFDSGYEADAENAGSGELLAEAQALQYAFHDLDREGFVVIKAGLRKERKPGTVANPQNPEDCDSTPCCSWVLSVSPRLGEGEVSIDKPGTAC